MTTDTTYNDNNLFLNPRCQHLIDDLAGIAEWNEGDSETYFKDSLRRLLYQRLPRKMLCTDDLSWGTVEWQKHRAIQKKYIQANPETLIQRLVLDIDTNIAHIMNNGGFASLGLPEPSWAALNVTNKGDSHGRGHVCYELLAPVPRSAHENTRQKPQNYVKAILKALRFYLDECNINADKGYTGLLMKNPYHSDFRVRGSGKAYALDDIACFLDLNKRDKPRPKGAKLLHDELGRNCTLFESLRHYAYKIGRSGQFTEKSIKADLEREALAINAQFEAWPDGQLSESEVRAVVNNIVRWMMTRWHTFKSEEHKQQYIKNTHTSEIQAKRGRLGGYASGKVRYDKTIEDRNKVIELADKGYSTRKIEKETGIKRSTVHRYLTRV